MDGRSFGPCMEATAAPRSARRSRTRMQRSDGARAVLPRQRLLLRRRASTSTTTAIGPRCWDTARRSRATPSRAGGARRPCSVATALGLGRRRAARPAGGPISSTWSRPTRRPTCPPNATLAAHYAVVRGLPGRGRRPGHARPGSRRCRRRSTRRRGGSRSRRPIRSSPGATYTVRWPALRGLNAAAPGTGGQAALHGRRGDRRRAARVRRRRRARPGISLRQTNDCTDSIEERFVFDLDLGAATDDGGRDGLTLMLFQTSGPAASGGVGAGARARPAARGEARAGRPADGRRRRTTSASRAWSATRPARSRTAPIGEACVDTTAAPLLPRLQRGAARTPGRRRRRCCGLVAALLLARAPAARPPEAVRWIALRRAWPRSPAATAAACPTTTRDGAARRRAARRRSRAPGAAARSGTRACPTTASGPARTARGATVCVGGERAAGVAPAPPDPALDLRRAARARRPIASARGSASIRRPTSPTGKRDRVALPHALRSSPAPRLRSRPRGLDAGSACDPARPCADGSRCVAGRCALPDQPARLLARHRLSERALPVRPLRRGAPVNAPGRRCCSLGAALGCRRTAVRGLPRSSTRPPRRSASTRRFRSRRGSTCPELAGGSHHLAPARRASLARAGAGERRLRADRTDAAARRSRVPGPVPVGRGSAVAAHARRGDAGGDLERRPGPRACARGPDGARRRARAASPTPPSARASISGGAGWHLLSRPPGAPRRSSTADGVASLLPDVAGDYRLADGDGRELTLRSARYDETPLDCGRAGCHARDHRRRRPQPDDDRARARARAAAGAATPAFGPGYPACALACHATGEPGLHDGGFARCRRRAGLVGRSSADAGRSCRARCAASAGSAASPATGRPRSLHPSARWSVLRSDVCAVCHDAPPRYGHVVAWRAPAMARADRDARARSDRACARCHTTAGFLDPTRRRHARPAPARRRRSGRHHLRRLPRGSRPRDRRAAGRAAARAGHPGAARAGRSRRRVLPFVCRCHTPEPEAPRPSASAAALWLGRGGLDPASGEPLDGAAIHAGVEGGCIGCHRSGPAGVERGAGHAFAAPPDQLHALPPAGDATRPTWPSARRRLWSAWLRAAGTTASGPGPAHASDVRLDRATPLGRAGWDVLLVLEDRAAGRPQRALRAGPARRRGDRVLRPRTREAKDEAAASGPASRSACSSLRRARSTARRRKAAASSEVVEHALPPRRPDRGGHRRRHRRFYNQLAGARLDLAVLAARQLRRLPRLREPQGQGRPRQQRARPTPRWSTGPERPATPSGSRSASPRATCRATARWCAWPPASPSRSPRASTW